MSSWNKDLYEAIITKNIHNIEKYILKGAGPNQTYNNNLPLDWAVLTGETQIVKILLDKGANPNVKIHVSPLIYSILERQYNIAKYLIKMGANPCQPCRGGITPLSYAITDGNLDLIEVLLDNGAEFTLPTGLMTAIGNNKAEIVRLLLERRVSVNFTNKDGLTPLLKTMEGEEINLDIVDALLQKGANPNVFDPDGKTPLLKAINIWNTELVEKLVRNRADVNSPDQNGTYPIIKAVCKGNFGIVKILIKNGARLNVRDAKGDTPFLKSVRIANSFMIKYLVEEVDINEKNYENETALSLALSNFDFNTFDLLVKRGANMDLASEAIEEMINNNLDFAVYMAEKKEAKDVKALELRGNNGHEEALVK